MSLSARYTGMEKTPKSILEEQNVKRKPFGARLEWGEHKVIGDGRFSVSCSFTKEFGFSPITATGSGQGKRNAEHDAAEQVLLQMEIRCGTPSQSRSSALSSQRVQPYVLQPPLPPPSFRVSVGEAKYEKDGSKAQKVSVDRNNIDRRIETLVSAPDSLNYIGMLQEICVAELAALPVYTEPDFDEATMIFTTTCTAGGVRTTGTAMKGKISKKIAAYKMYSHFKSKKSEPPKSTASLEVKRLALAFKDVKINSSPPRKPESQRKVMPRSPLIPPATDGETLQISDIIWMYTKKILGTGGFSEVFKGYKEDPSCQIAIKRVPKAEAEKTKNKEREILQHVKHENLVSYFLTVIKDGYFYYVMELAKCSLYDWLNDGSHESDTLVKICKDVALGLKELHRRGVVHRDMKPGNILIFMEEVTGKQIPKAKLTDFGISRVLGSDQEATLTTSGCMGTQIFMPPEAKPEMKLFPSFDIFSLGIVLCFVMTGKKHLFAEPGKETKAHIQTNILDDHPNWNLVMGKKFTSLKNLLQVMVSKNPKRRSDMGVLLEHPFFWSTQECFNFLVKVSNDIKNVGTCNSAISKAAQDYLWDFPDWKFRLDRKIIRWIDDRDKKLDEMKRKGSPVKDGWRKYSGTSIIQLINFIRDQQQHYSNWRSSELECEEIFGKNGCNYGSYFIRTYPELPTLLYNVLQDSRLRGNETSTYYKNNSFSCFEFKL